MARRKYFRLFLVVFAFGFFAVAFSGCATVPDKPGGESSYTLHGTAYYPLVSLCGRRNVEWEYDPYTQKISLARDRHSITARVGDPLVLVDNAPVTLRQPVELYHGVVVVPRQFKSDFFDAMFKGTESMLPAACPLPLFKKVVIDAGHGGHDPGAISRNGLQEKDVNLDVAKRLAAILRKSGVEVVMTRNSDFFIPLPERHAIANRAQADLFVSVHTNSSKTRSLNGFEVYYVCPTVSDIRRGETAAREERLPFPESAFAGESYDLKATLWDMLYASSRAESIGLSRSICNAAQADLGVKILGVKPGRFEVLKGARMPAVLVEAGFLSHTAEERKLGNGYYRQKIADSIAGGILGYERRSLARDDRPAGHLYVEAGR